MEDSAEGMLLRAGLADTVLQARALIKEGGVVIDGEPVEEGCERSFPTRTPVLVTSRGVSVHTRGADMLLIRHMESPKNKRMGLLSVTLNIPLYKATDNMMRYAIVPEQVTEWLLSGREFGGSVAFVAWEDAATPPFVQQRRLAMEMRPLATVRASENLMEARGRAAYSAALHHFDNSMSTQAFVRKHGVNITQRAGFTLNTHEA